jgi:4-amino-4-deoxy-L-arabinose transferase-like glycosyltransferase
VGGPRRFWYWVGGIVCLISMCCLLAFLRSQGVSRWQVAHLLLVLLGSLGLLGLFLLCCYGLGRLLIGRLGFGRENPGEFGLFALIAGMGLLSLLMLVIGALGLLYGWSAWILLGAGSLLAVVHLVRHRAFCGQVLVRAAARYCRQLSPWELALLAVLVIELFYPLVTYALVPPISWDEVAYHLAVPKTYVQDHSIVYIPYIPYSNWPMGSEMLSTVALLLGSESLAHLVSWSALLLTCAGLWLFGNRYLGRPLGLLAAALFAATPMVGALAGTALVEVPLALYASAAVLAFLRWIETKERRWWLLSAALGGLAASTKLNGALVPLILGVLGAAEALFHQPRRVSRSTRLVVVYGLVSLAVVSPWYLKSFLHTGNPVWPFFIDLLGGRNWDALGNEYLLGFIKLVNRSPTVSNWLLGIWNLTAHPEQFGPGGIAIGWNYLILLPLAAAALIRGGGSHRRVLLWLSAAAVALYTAWFLQTHQARFLLPVTPVLCLLMAYGVGWLLRAKWRPGKLLVQTVVVVGLVAGSWILDEEARALALSRWPFLAGSQTREEFLAAHAPGYGAFQYANEHLPQESYVLLALYECRGYYLDREYMWANPISQRYLRLEQFADADELYQHLTAQMGFTHVLYAPKRIEQYEYIRYGPHYSQLFLDLLEAHCRRVYESPDLVLYALE